MSTGPTHQAGCSFFNPDITAQITCSCGALRAEALALCKRRALELVDRGELQEAVTSMLSDLGKHPELRNHAGGSLGAMLLLGGFLSHKHDVIKWIEGFN